MFMNGEILTDLNDLKRCFSIDELLYSYGNGELEIFLEKIGEHEKAEQIQEISENNALLLIRLYDIWICRMKIRRRRSGVILRKTGNLLWSDRHTPRAHRSSLACSFVLQGDYRTVPHIQRKHCIKHA